MAKVKFELTQSSGVRMQIEGGNPERIGELLGVELDGLLWRQVRKLMEEAFMRGQVERSREIHNLITP